MKANKIFYAVGLLALTACSADTDLSELSDRVPINLGYTTLTANETRANATTTLNDETITTGRTVMVRISSDNGASYTDYNYTTAASGAMTPPSPKPYYPASGTVKIVAYHPSDAGTSFSINTDQTTDANYNACDLMFSDNITAQAKTTNAVNLQFVHKMAKIVVTATKGDGVNYITSMTLKDVKPTVSFNQTTGAVGTASGTAGNVSIFTGGGSSTTTANGAAVIPAQTITGALLEIVTDQGTAIYDVGSTGKAFVAGSKYSMNVTVNRSAVGVTNSVAWTNTATLTVEPTVVIEPAMPTVAAHAPSGATAVDLGLPSGTLWANMNVGATAVTDYGTYFAWGETVGYAVSGQSSTVVGSPTKTTYDWANYWWGDGSSSAKFKKYCPSNQTSYLATGFSGDTKTVLDLSDDAAYINWGGSWRMPTQAEFQELLDNTTKTWTTESGVQGYKFAKTSDASVYIFLPAAGYRYDTSVGFQGEFGDYWSSSLSGDGPNYAWYLNVYSGAAYVGSLSRCLGYTVRAVQEN